MFRAQFSTKFFSDKNLKRGYDKKSLPNNNNSITTKVITKLKMKEKNFQSNHRGRREKKNIKHYSISRSRLFPPIQVLFPEKILEKLMSLKLWRCSKNNYFLKCSTTLQRRYKGSRNRISRLQKNQTRISNPKLSKIINSTQVRIKNTKSKTCI